MHILANVLIFAVILVASAGIAFLTLDPLARLGVFGSCFEGGCGYAAIFLGLPIITLLLTVLACVIWVILRRRSRREREG